MKIAKSDLLSALAVANRVVDVKSKVPILECGKVKDGYLYATNLDIGVEIPMMSQEPPSKETFTFPLKRMTEIVKSLESETVELLENDGVMSVNGGLFEINVLPADEFPDFEIPENIATQAVVGKDALKNVLPAVTKEEYVSGVYFDAEAGRIVATDGHRLHMEPAIVNDLSFLLNADHAKALLKTAGKDDSEITLGVNTRKILIEDTQVGGPEILNDLTKTQLINLADDFFGLKFTAKDKVADIRKAMADTMEATKPAPEYREEVQHLVVKLGDASFVMRPLITKFPDYHAVVPDTFAYDVKVQRGEFLNAVTQALTMANERYKAVRLTFNGKSTIEMEALNPEVGSYRRLSVPMKGHVEPAIESGYNPVYLRDIMNITKDDESEFSLGLNDATKPLVFTQGTFTGLVMPMRV